MVPDDDADTEKKGGEGGFERVSTGIPGLDDLLNSGIPDGNLTLLTGPPGTGKSTFASQYLIEGAKEGRTGVYVSLGESRERIIKNLRAFGWDIDEFLDEDMIEVISPELYKYDKLMREIKNSARDMDADLYVLDSITVLKSYFQDDFTIRRKIMGLKKVFEDLGVTTLTTAESPHIEERTEIGIEEYVVDGVIQLFYDKDEASYSRYVAVKKMRGTEHSMDIYPITIGKGGIKVDS